MWGVITKYHTFEELQDPPFLQHRRFINTNNTINATMSIEPIMEMI